YGLFQSSYDDLRAGLDVAGLRVRIGLDGRDDVAQRDAAAGDEDMMAAGIVDIKEPEPPMPAGAGMGGGMGMM
nr:hypothetical protein [Clostridia bacterium]